LNQVRSGIRHHRHRGGKGLEGLPVRGERRRRGEGGGAALRASAAAAAAALTRHGSGWLFSAHLWLHPWTALPCLVLQVSESLWLSHSRWMDVHRGPEYFCSPRLRPLLLGAPAGRTRAPDRIAWASIKAIPCHSMPINPQVQLRWLL
jgi:hypothetical protein